MNLLSLYLCFKLKTKNNILCCDSEKNLDSSKFFTEQPKRVCLETFEKGLQTKEQEWLENDLETVMIFLGIEFNYTKQTLTLDGYYHLMETKNLTKIKNYYYKCRDLEGLIFFEHTIMFILKIDFANSKKLELLFVKSLTDERLLKKLKIEFQIGIINIENLKTLEINDHTGFFINIFDWFGCENLERLILNTIDTCFAEGIEITQKLPNNTFQLRKLENLQIKSKAFVFIPKLNWNVFFDLKFLDIGDFLRNKDYESEIKHIQEMKPNSIVLKKIEEIKLTNKAICLLYNFNLSHSEKLKKLEIMAFIEELVSNITKNVFYSISKELETLKLSGWVIKFFTLFNWLNKKNLKILFVQEIINEIDIQEQINTIGNKEIQLNSLEVLKLEGKMIFLVFKFFFENTKLAVLDLKADTNLFNNLATRINEQGGVLNVGIIKSQQGLHIPQNLLYLFSYTIKTDDENKQEVEILSEECKENIRNIKNDETKQE